MNVYVETNFLLEVALVQEQHESCERIIGLCDSGCSTLIVPTFSIAESYETLIRRARERTQIANRLGQELRQLSRSKPYKEQVDALQGVAGLLVQSIDDENGRLTAVLERVSKIAVLIPLAADIISAANRCRAIYKLEPQDSFVYCSVLHHLDLQGGAEGCFINRNSKDFSDLDIVESLESRGCKMLYDFDTGWGYLSRRAPPGSGK